MAATATVAALLLPAAPVQAQDCVAPPGRSAIEQYCESIPGAGGERSARDPRVERRTAVPAGTEQALRSAGADGEAVLALPGGVADATGGPGTGDRERGGSSSGDGAGGDAGVGGLPGAGEARALLAAGGSPGDNPVSAVGAALASAASSGFGIAFLALAGLLALAAVARIFARRSG